MESLDNKFKELKEISRGKKNSEVIDCFVRHYKEKIKENAIAPEEIKIIDNHSSKEIAKKLKCVGCYTEEHAAESVDFYLSYNKKITANYDAVFALALS